MESFDLNLSKLPIWIQLSNIPLELFTKTGLSYIASAVGVPLYCDKITALQKRLSFARICIEVDVNEKIPEVIEVVMKEGNVVNVYTKVPWMPQKCGKCKIFGHSDKNCVKKEVAKWVRKVATPNLEKDPVIVDVVQNPVIVDDGMGKDISADHVITSINDNVHSNEGCMHPIAATTSMYDVLQQEEDCVDEEIEFAIAEEFSIEERVLDQRPS